MTDPGHQGRAELYFSRRGRRTILQRSYTSLPARIIRPFYWEDDGRAYLYLLTPTGGMLGGDRLDIHIVLEAGAQVCLTTAAATKVHPATDSPAVQTLRIELGVGSCLEYLPEPTILFRDARWQQRTLVHRAADSRLLLVEAWSAGRIARQEVFAFTSLETALDIFTAGHLSVYDRLRLQPATYPFQQLGLWAGHPHLLTLYLLQESPPTSTWLEEVRQCLANHPGPAGLSRLATPGIVARALADDAEALTRLMQVLWCLVRQGSWGETWNFWRK
ncbi:MAG TPA: urease accessory protein UreD [Alphaproteobacteria bacterium]|nr:urease accessory protein UreD [Alphaproteobacteria bacterium]